MYVCAVCEYVNTHLVSTNKIGCAAVTMLHACPLMDTHLAASETNPDELLNTIKSIGLKTVGIMSYVPWSSTRFKLLYNPIIYSRIGMVIEKLQTMVQEVCNLNAEILANNACGETRQPPFKTDPPNNDHSPSISKSKISFFIQFFHIFPRIIFISTQKPRGFQPIPSPFRRHRDIDVAGHFAAGGPVTRDVGAGRTLGHGDAGHQLLLRTRSPSEMGHGK